MTEHWKERLVPAIYRGVSFGVVSAESEHGQRLFAHQFPQRDEPLVDWMGRKVRRFRITGFLIGDDYAERLERLIKVFETPPPGFPFQIGTTMQHPYRGALRVIGRTIRVKESTLEGRMARVEMTFLEPGREIAPPATTGGQVGKASSASTAAQTAAAAALEEDLLVNGVAETVRAATALEITKMGQAIAALDVFTGASKEVAALGFKVEQMINTAAGLAVAPATLAATVLDVFTGISASVSNAAGALTAYSSVLNLAASLDGGSSVASIAADSNAIATSDFMKSSAVGEAVVAAIQVPWASSNEALEQQALLTAQLDDLLLRARDDIFPKLQDVRSAAASGIPAPGQNLPSLVSLTLPGAVPVLVLAHKLYGDAKREAEIVDRNSIRHPLFAPGLQPLEVLSV